MNKKLLIILIIFGVLVVAGGIYWWQKDYIYYKIFGVVDYIPGGCNQSGVRQCSDGLYVSRTGPNCEFAECPLSNLTSTSSINTSNWQIYRNEKYGFEVKYPLDFKEQKAESDMTLLAIMKTDRGSSHYFTISVIKNYRVEQILSTIEEVKEINIGGHLGYKYFYIEGAGMSEVALFQVGKDALNISFDLIGNGQNFATANDRKIYIQNFFDQILSTFKFTK